MGLFDEILKGLPVNPLLREKIADIEAKYAASETENAGLRDDLREARSEIRELKTQVQELSKKDELDKMEVLLIQLLADSEIDHDAEALASGLNENLTRVRYHLQRLAEMEYVETSGVSYFGEPVPYYLSQRGREYLVKNSLLPD